MPLAEVTAEAARQCRFEALGSFRMMGFFQKIYLSAYFRVSLLTIAQEVASLGLGG